MQFYSNMKGRIIWERPTTQRLPLGGDVLFTLRIIWKIERHIKKKTIQRKIEPLRWPSGGFERVRVIYSTVIKTKAQCFFLDSVLTGECSCHLPHALLSAKDLFLLHRVPREELCHTDTHGMHVCSLPRQLLQLYRTHLLLSDGCISTRVY